MLLDSKASLFVLASVSFLLLVASGGGRIKKAVMLTLIVSVWGIVLSQGMFYQEYPRTVLFCIISPGESFQGLCVYREGLFYGLVQALRLFTALCGSLLVVLSTSRQELLKTVSKLPLPRGLTLMSVSAVRALPLVAEEFALVRKALKIKGYKPLKVGLLRTVQVELSTLLPLLTVTVKRSRQLTDLLILRGFNPLRPSTTSVLLPKWPKGEAIFSITVLLATLAVATIKVLFWLYVNDILYIPDLIKLYAFTRKFL